MFSNKQSFAYEMARKVDKRITAPEKDRLLLITDIHSENPTEVIQSALRRGYEFIWVSELIAALDGKGSLPRKAALLTFDDGRVEQFTLAHPILTQYKVKSTFFITSDYLYGKPVDITLSPYPYMTWDNARTMHATGLYEWHNHTRTHKGLTTQTSAERRSDLLACQRAIVKELGAPTPTAIAYPNGNFDHNCIADFKSMGFKIGFTTAPKKDERLSTMGCHPFTINRLLTSDKSWLDQGMDDSFYYWGDDLVNERNANNRLKYWTAPASGFSYDFNGEDLRLDSRVVTTEGVLETTDYFRVRPADIIYCSFYSQSELQTAGNGGIRLMQYGANKSLIASTDLKSYAASATNTRTDAEIKLSESAVYIKIQMWYDANYNGILHMKNAIFRRAYP